MLLTKLLWETFTVTVLQKSAGNLPLRSIRSCIHTGWPAAKVDHSAPGRVTVTCRDGRKEQGTHVVCTLPLSVLQDGVGFVLLLRIKSECSRCMVTPSRWSPAYLSVAI